MVSSDFSQQQTTQPARTSGPPPDARKRLRRWPAWATVVILVALVALWLTFRFYLLARYEAVCISNGRAMQLEIDRQLADLGEQPATGSRTSTGQTGSPSTVDLTAISLTNPFSRQPISLITPGDRYRPGDLLLIPADARVTRSQGDPSRATISTAIPAYYVLPIGLRARKLRQFHGYADLDRDGIADPLIGCFDGLSVSGKGFQRTVDFEPVETALKRQGIRIDQGPRPALRVNQVPFLRFLLGLRVY